MPTVYPGDDIDQHFDDHRDRALQEEAARKKCGNCKAEFTAEFPAQGFCSPECGLIALEIDGRPYAELEGAWEHVNKHRKDP